jgi:hydrogenase nickel incorporation protein HypA/HybF
MHVSKIYDCRHRGIMPPAGLLAFEFTSRSTCTMHELSIIHSIIETVEATVQKRGGAVQVECVYLQIGRLAGVEVENIEFLWPAAIQDTLLEGAACAIERIAGEAVCLDCQNNYTVNNYFDPCPACGSFWKEVKAGEELKIKSIEICAQPADAVAMGIN